MLRRPSSMDARVVAPDRGLMRFGMDVAAGGTAATMAGGLAWWLMAMLHYKWRSLTLWSRRPSGESLPPPWSEPATTVLLGVVFPLGGVVLECLFPYNVVGAKTSG